MLNATLGGSAHIVELQVHLARFIAIKGAGGGHAGYRYARKLHGFDACHTTVVGCPGVADLERAEKGARL